MQQQREIQVMQAVKPRVVVDIPILLVAQCKNYREAVMLCIQFGHFTHAQIAERLGMAKGTFSQILLRGGTEKRKRYLDPDYFGAIEEMCGNRAITQYFDMQSKGLLNRQNTGDRIAALRRELAELEASTQRLEESTCPSQPLLPHQKLVRAQ